MKRQNFNMGYTFMPAKNSNSWWLSEKSIPVNLPHDWSITLPRDKNSLSGACSAFAVGGVCVYEKKFTACDSWSDQCVMLEFDGAYQHTNVHFNGQLLCLHPYGYTAFHVDLTPYLRFDGENTLAITVNNGALPNSRWYSGSGIYRDVTLLTAPKTHIAPWGVFVTTPKVSRELSTVRVETTVQGGGDVIVRQTLTGPKGQGIATIQTPCVLEGEGKVTHEMPVPNAHLWSVETPHLYTLTTELLQDEKVIDSHTTAVGIRAIELSAKDGLRINGQSVLLKGGCVHHDNGLLGSASYPRSEARRVELLKASGYNAIRCAHNPPSTAFLDACDRLGMLVMDEAFDCWREGKNPNDYHVHFEDWWQRDMSSMVLRDRNHPSIIFWSTGNEIIERDGRSNGYELSKQLADFIRTLDATRPITNALCGIPKEPSDEGTDYWAKKTTPFTTALDFVGYNYLLDRYENDGKLFPERIICGTESFPIQALENWEKVETLPYVIGDFVWTSLDYLGESGIGHVWYDENRAFLGEYPWHQAFCGDIDICGFKRPQSYYRDLVWGVSNTPFIAVHPPQHHDKTPNIARWGWPDVQNCWTWNGYEQKPVTVDVYAVGDEVELLKNGVSLGKQPSGRAHRLTATFETTYESGELIAICYENSKEISRSVLKTAGVPATIRLTADRQTLDAIYGDLAFVTVELFDAKGNPAHHAANQIFLSANGQGELLAVGNGDPKSEELYVGNTRKAHEGRLMATVRTKGEVGEITLTAQAEGLQSATIHLQAK